MWSSLLNLDKCQNITKTHAFRSIVKYSKCGKNDCFEDDTIDTQHIFNYATWLTSYDFSDKSFNWNYKT